MTSVKRIIVAIQFLVIVSFNGYGQSLKPLSIGDTVPLQIWKTIPRNKDTKLVVLDFWSTTCSSCIIAFPKIDQLVESYKKELTIVLVNSWETQKQVGERLKEINSRKIKNGEIPDRLPEVSFIYNDTILRRLFPLITIPHHVWLNKDGVVEAITNGYNLTKGNVQAYVNGKKPRLVTKDDIGGANLSKRGFLQPTLTNRYSIFYSAFIPFYPAVYNTIQTRDSINGTFRKTFYNRSVLDIYRTAFVVFEKRIENKRVLVESNLKEWFRSRDYLNERDEFDSWSENHTFSYELQGPLSSETKWKDKMQKDVNLFFGDLLGIVGEWQKRRFKSLILVKEESILSKSSSLINEYVNNADIFRITNYSFIEVLNYMNSKLENMNAHLPFIDETGIDKNMKIDFQLNGDIRDIGLLRRQLKNYGLNVIEAEREIDVFVISDKSDRLK